VRYKVITTIFRDYKPGDLIEKDSSDIYFSPGYRTIPSTVVENNPEWFEKVSEEKREIQYYPGEFQIERNKQSILRILDYLLRRDFHLTSPEKEELLRIKKDVEKE